MSTTLNSDLNRMLIQNISRCFDKSVLMVGDVMLDEFHWCHVKRISPEAPVPVCQVQKTTLVPGGAGNVAHNVNALGNTALLFGVIGTDSSGDKLVSCFSDRGIRSDLLIRDINKPTILKSRIIAHQQHVVRVDREHAHDISRRAQNGLIKTMRQHLSDSHVMVLSDYKKGTLPAPFTQRCIQLANDHHVKVVVDPKGDDYRAYKGAYLLTPNFQEFQAVVKKPLKTEADIHTAGLKLVKRLQLECLLITRSEKGMSLITKEGQKLDIPTRAQEVFDITGAGDTVIAVLSIALASGFSAFESAVLANYAAGIVVGKIGTATTTYDEITEALQHDL